MKFKIIKAEILKALEGEPVERMCCDECWNSEAALKGKDKEKFRCGLMCSCHLSQPPQPEDPLQPLRDKIDEMKRDAGPTCKLNHNDYFAGLMMALELLEDK